MQSMPTQQDRIVIEYKPLNVVAYDITRRNQPGGMVTREELYFFQVPADAPYNLEGKVVGKINGYELLTPTRIISSSQSSNNIQIKGNKLIPVSSYSGSVREFIENKMNIGRNYVFEYDGSIATVSYNKRCKRWVLDLENLQPEGLTARQPSLIIEGGLLDKLDTYITQHPEEEVIGPFHARMQPLIGLVTNPNILNQIRRDTKLKVDITIEQAIMWELDGGRIRYRGSPSSVPHRHNAALIERVNFD